MKKDSSKAYFRGEEVSANGPHNKQQLYNEEVEQGREGLTHEQHHAFNEKHVLHELKHYLPSQTPLKDFIHHNSLHAFQNLKFNEAIFRASKIFGYQVTLQLSEYRELYKNGRIREDVLDRIVREAKGESHVDEWKHKLISKHYDDSNSPRIGFLRSHWKSLYKIDLDNLVQPLLFR